MKILVTGSAGFIGFHTTNRLLKEGHEVVGYDCINSYYDVNLKYSRLEFAGIKKENIIENTIIRSESNTNYKFIKAQLENKEIMQKVFEAEKFDYVIHLAAQAGVRYSIENPYAYLESNLIGFLNIIECCRHFKIKHLAYASSSSVYGLNETIPFSTHENVDHPISLYAATKKSNELTAHCYSYLYKIPTTGLRFFTVYGPWGRPDMALFIFTKAILENKTIDVFNNGEMKRDFTYIDDIVTGIINVVLNPPKGNTSWTGKNPDPSSSVAPYKIYNIGNNRPEKLMDFISTIEKHIGKEAKKNFLPLQAGDVPATYADVDDLITDFNFKPNTSVETGIGNFIKWYREYYGE